MRRRLWTLASLLLLSAGLAHAQGAAGKPCDPCESTGQCAAVDPILSGSDHHCEEHAKHDHSGLDLIGVNLFRTSFSSGSLAGTKIQASTLKYARLYGVDFTGGELNQVDADNTVLIDADLTGATLIDTTLRGGAHARADFTGAFLLADFTGANLRQAVFTGAVLSATEGIADFSNANLADAVGLADTVGVARYSACTDFGGTGFDPVAAGWILTDGAPIGESYCGPAPANSTGEPAVILATGCEEVFANALVLRAEQLPQNQNGYFLASMTQGFVQNPGGSQGDLCLGGTIGRFVDQIANSGAAGVIEATVDLTNMPKPLQAVVLPGDTFNFQAWYRDMNPTTTSNLTDAVEVKFD